MMRDFRPIPNTIHHALMRAGLSGTAYQIVLTIIDRTLGFVERDGVTRRQKAPISLTHFVKATRLSRSGVIKAIKALKEARIILPDKQGTRKTIYAINMNTSEWASEQAFTSEVGNSSAPVWTTDVHQTSTLSTNGTTATKETPKEIYIKKGDVPSEEGNTLNLIIKDVMDAIALKQGYSFMYPGKEAKAIKKALEKGYAKEDILGCWDNMKTNVFWQDKHLSLVSVVERVGIYKSQKVVEPQRMTAAEALEGLGI